MMWRTLALSAVNVVTVAMAFLPIAEVTSVGHVEEIFLHHTSPPYFFLIQLALGLFAVVIDMLNKRPHLQGKLLAAGVALSAALAGVTFWLVFQFDNMEDLVLGTEMKIGAWIPLLNVLLFGIVWFDQRRRTAVK